MMNPFKLFKSITSRPLTTGEIAMAESVFGDALDVSDIRLCAHRLVLKGYAISPNGKIYFHKDGLPDDFSELSLGMRSWLVHELAHVWQIQQGIKVVRGALFDRRYQYAIKTRKNFFKYGIEQQAQIIQDYYIAREKGQSCEPFESCIPFILLK